MEARARSAAVPPRTERSVFPQPRRACGASTCFLCARRLGARNRTDEHVVSDWVQDRFKLRHEHLVLVNGTTIPYRHLKIPACRDCNTIHLNRIENQVARAAAAGAVAVRELDPFVLYVWLGKTLYGILYKELTLRADRRLPRSRPIIPRKVLRQLLWTQFCLQQARYPMQVVPSVDGCEFPLASIFVFDVKRTPRPEHGFDLRDDLATLSIAMQLGDVGLVACLGDGGACKREIAPLVASLEGRTLHPLQFREVHARIFYIASLFDRVPKYMTIEHDDGIEIMRIPLAGLSRQPVFRTGNASGAAPYLANATGQPVDWLSPDGVNLRSWIFDPAGEFVELGFDEQPWPPIAAKPPG
jgi:hypothetical protein